MNRNIDLPLDARRDDLEHRRAWQGLFNTAVSALGHMSVEELENFIRSREASSEEYVSGNENVDSDVRTKRDSYYA